MTADTHDAERLAEVARLHQEARELLARAQNYHLPANWMATARICTALIRQIEDASARDARIAELETQYEALRDQTVMLEQERDCFKATAEAQRGNAATIGELRTALAEACPGAGPTSEGGWPVSHAVLLAGYEAYVANEARHGTYETFMAVWNAMHRAHARVSPTAGMERKP